MTSPTNNLQCNMETKLTPLILYTWLQSHKWVWEGWQIIFVICSFDNQASFSLLICWVRLSKLGSVALGLNLHHQHSRLSIITLFPVHHNTKTYDTVETKWKITCWPNNGHNELLTLGDSLFPWAVQHCNIVTFQMESNKFCKHWT